MAHYTWCQKGQINRHSSSVRYGEDYSCQPMYAVSTWSLIGMISERRIYATQP